MYSELNEFVEFERKSLQLYNFGKLEELERQRKQFLSEQNALKYFFLTDLLGMDYEDEELHKRGAAFFYEFKKSLNEESENSENKKRKDFVLDAEKLLNSGSKYAEDYRKCLSKHFFKFSHKGEKSVYKMEDYAVIVLLGKLYESYKKKLN
jgi:hypothetical protein